MDLKWYIARNYKLNSSQEKLLLILQSVSNYFNSNKIVRYLKKLQHKGIYIYGEVGVGKTMMMRAFYKSVRAQAGYFHYQTLMHDLYAIATKNLENSGNLIKKLVYEYSQKYKVICIDEFEIKDIASALLIGNFIKWLLVKKVYVVLTSNIAPNNLYLDGLKRELFLPYIDIIKQNIYIFYLQSDLDYRQKKLNL